MNAGRPPRASQVSNRSRLDKLVGRGPAGLHRDYCRLASGATPQAILHLAHSPLDIDLCVAASALLRAGYQQLWSRSLREAVEALFRAILAMDSYDRGYNAGLKINKSQQIRLGTLGAARPLPKHRMRAFFA